VTTGSEIKHVISSGYMGSRDDEHVIMIIKVLWRDNWILFSTVFVTVTK